MSPQVTISYLQHLLSDYLFVRFEPAKARTNFLMTSGGGYRKSVPQHRVSIFDDHVKRLLT